MNPQHDLYDLDRLKAISISEVARRLGDDVRRVGSSHVTLCPWHDDHHPSLSLAETKGRNFCHCFSCGNGGDTIAFVQQHEGWTFQEACEWLSRQFGIGTTRSNVRMPKPKQRQAVKPATPAYTYIPAEMLDELVSPENSLCRCLMHIFHPEAVKWLAEEYRLGCYSMNGLDDYTVFPSIDIRGRVCNLKVQHYCTMLGSPRFAHSDQTAYWLGSMWAREGRLPAGSEFRSDSLFGEHLLQSRPSSKVALVESPKNALFGALAFPNYTWLATGNKGNLKRESLKPLQGRDVVIFPDCDAIDVWTEKIRTMADIANFSVSDFCRRMAPQGQTKYDIADYLQQRWEAAAMPF